MRLPAALHGPTGPLLDAVSTRKGPAQINAPVTVALLAKDGEGVRMRMVNGRPLIIATVACAISAVTASAVVGAAPSDRGTYEGVGDSLLAEAGFALAAFEVGHRRRQRQAPAAVEGWLRSGLSSDNAEVRALARWRLARRHAMRGELATAAKLKREGGHISTAWLLGPFEDPSGAILNDGHAAELHQVDLSKTYSGLGGEVGWQRIRAEPRDGLFVVDRALRAVRDTSALLIAAVNSPRRLRGWLRLEVSGGAAVVDEDGAKAASIAADRDLGWDQLVVPVELAPGANLIRLRLHNSDRALRIRLRLTDSAGDGLRGVRVVDRQALLKRARAIAIVDGVAENESTVLQPPSEVAALAAAVVEDRLRKAASGQSRPFRVETLVEPLLQSVDDDVQRFGPEQRPLVGLCLRLYADAMASVDATAARRAYEAALRVDDDDLLAILGLAELRDAQGFRAWAKELYHRAQRLAPHSPVVELAVLQAATADELDDSLSRDARWLALAEVLPSRTVLSHALSVARDRWHVAHVDRLIEVLFAIDVADGAAVNARIQTVAHDRLVPPMERLRQVIEFRRRRLKYFPHNHRFAEDLAMSLAALGNRDDVDKLIQERMHAFPQRVEPALTATRAALALDDRAWAKTFLSKAKALAPQDPRVSTLWAALDDGGDSLATLYGLDDSVLRRDNHLAGADEIGAQLVGQVIAARFHADGQSTTLRERIIHVLDDKKAAALAQVTIPYVPDREKLTVLIAERHGAHGAVEHARVLGDHAPQGKQAGMYTDVAYRRLAFSELNTGDRIWLRFRHQSNASQNLFGDFFGSIENLQEILPVGQTRFVIEVPRGRTLHFGGRGVPTPTRQQRADYDVFSFHVDDVPRLVLEPSSPPAMERADYVSVSTYERWSELGDWYAHFVEPQLRLSQQLRQLAKSLVEGADSVDEKVRRVYEYVVKNTRYVGIELGIHGWKPYPVVDVHRRRYGDCKDKASLMVALLREVGVDARMVLLRTADRGLLEDEPPSMWAFNHAITYIPELDRFVDGTAESAGAHELPALDQGALALIVAPVERQGQSELRVTAVRPASENLNRSKYRLQIVPDGTLDVDGLELFSGIHAPEHRRKLADEATQVNQLQKELGAYLPGTVVHEVEATELSLAAREVGYRFKATIRGHARRDDDGLTIPISLYPHQLTRSYASVSPRRSDVWVSTPWQTRNEMHYVLPEGFDVVDLPESSTIQGKHLKFTQAIERTKAGFTVVEDTAILSRRIPVGDYEEFRRQAQQADALMKRTLRISTTKGEPR